MSYGKINAWLAGKGLMVAAEDLVLDGTIYELKNEEFKGWYVGSEVELDGKPYITLTVGNWKTHEKHTYKSSTSSLSDEDKQKVKHHQESLKKKKQEEKALANAESRRLAKKILSKLSRKGLEQHPYVKKKKLEDFVGLDPSVGVDSGKIIIPAYVEGQLIGIQRISKDGVKRFLTGQQTQGQYHCIGTFVEDAPIAICEGYATALTVHSATRYFTVCAFSAQNMYSVVSYFRKLVSPKSPIVVYADDDRQSEVNTGKQAAKKIKKDFNATVAHLPPIDGCTDFNDYYIAEGFERLKAICLDPEIVYPPVNTPGFYNKTEKNVAYKEAIAYFSLIHPFVNTDKGTYVYKDQHYKLISKTYIKAFANEYIRDANGKNVSSRVIDEFTKRILCHNYRREEWFEQTTENFINFRNGVYDRTTKSLFPHTPHRGFLFRLNYDYDPEATAPVWEEALRTMTQDDDSLSNLLEEYVGYCLSNDKIWDAKALVLVGDGANGKSTFIDTVNSLLGPENIAAVGVAGLGNETRRDMIHGKLAILCEENSVRNFESEVFKAIVGGGTIDARALYKGPYQFRNKAKTIIAFNRFDHVTDLSNGLFRRLLIAPFNHVFKDGDSSTDKHIQKKLNLELSGIFNRCWEKYLKARARQNFTEVERVKHNVQRLSEESDQVWQFVNEHDIKINPADQPPTFVSYDILFEAFKNWSQASNIRYPLQKVAFNRRFERIMEKNNTDKRFKRIIKHHQGKTQRGWENIEFVPPHLREF